MEKPTDENAGGSEIKQGSSEDHQTLAGVNRNANVHLEGERIPGLFNESTAWDVYNNEARKVDSELVKDWTASLNFLLVFTAIFSAVLAAFIIESKKMLEQDPGDVMVDVMIFYTNSVANGTHNPYQRANFVPTNAAISINCLLFGSLSASLVAALASVIALQWVAEFDAAITRGGSSPQDRAKRRQFRFAGIEKWRMGGIIAALPLILYFSVVLFFAGVIQWMLLLHQTVGYVVITGAVVAGLFYFSSTIIAVTFVSAPFKSPLSQWIYAFQYLPGVITHWIVTTAHIKEVPRWITAHRKAYYTAHKREDLAVESSVDLPYQAMNWLARQLTISEGYRRRLLLLITELLEWPTHQLESPDFLEGPWIYILDFLSTRHRDALHVSDQTRDEELELAILIRCARLPVISAAITPNEQVYVSDPEADEYWSQYCVTSTGSPTQPQLRHESLSAPHNAFLVTRDLPVPSLNLQAETRAALRLAKWRSSEAKTLADWKIIFSSTDVLSQDFFNSSVCILCSYARKNAPNWPIRTMKGTFTSIVSDITKRATVNGISYEALIMLIHAFECSLHTSKQNFGSTHPAKSGVPFTNLQPCIKHPISYTRNLAYADKAAQKLHRIMTLLLAQNLRLIQSSERGERFKDVLMMLWVNPPEDTPRDWRHLESRYGYYLDFSRQNKYTLKLNLEIEQDWVFYVEKSPENMETIGILFQTYVAQDDIGDEWLTSCGRRSRGGIFSLFTLVDSLLEHKHQATTRMEIFSTLCKVLQRLQVKSSPIVNESPDRANESQLSFPLWGTTEDPESPFSILQNPYLRTIAYRHLGPSGTQDGIPECLSNRSLNPAISDWFSAEHILAREAAGFVFSNMAEQDPEWVWKLRAGYVTESFATGSPGNKIVHESFSNPEQLVRRIFRLWLTHLTTTQSNLERIFAHPTSCLRNSGPGHILRHLETGHYKHRFKLTMEKSLFGIPLNSRLPALYMLLSISYVGELQHLEIGESEIVCITRIWRHLDALREMQSSMFTFLLCLPFPHPKSLYFTGSGTLAIYLKAIEECAALSLEKASIPLLLPLSERILGIDCFFRSTQDVETIKSQCQRISNLLQTVYAEAKVVSGRRNIHSLSCARSKSSTCPATGWWPIYPD